MVNVLMQLWLACLKIIFTFLHLTFSGLQYFDLVWSLFKRKIEAMYSMPGGNAEICISQCVTLLEKKPRHLALILGQEEIRCEDFTNFVIWCLAAGISFLSVYDNSGITREKEVKLYEHVLKHIKTSHSHVKFRNIPTKNGVRNDYKNQIFVSILSEMDGKDRFAETVRRLCGSRKSSEIDVDVINSELKSDSKFPDPDVAVLVGPAVSTYGFPPWQIPVTEFVQVPTIKNIEAENFCNLLFKYSKCQQRFGK